MPPRTPLNDVLAAAVARADLPFAVAMVGDADGVLWEGAFGDAAPQRPAAPDTMFRLASMSKAVGILSALILVDRGVLALDTPVASVLPEFADIQVLVSIGPDGPVLRPPRRPVLLSHLLTHTSGLAHSFSHPNQFAYRALTGLPDTITGRLAALQRPLQFDPGDALVYGIGVDWAGRMVERADGRRIDRFCTEEIFEPLGMIDTVFEIDGHEDRLAGQFARSGDGGLEPTDLYVVARQPEFYPIGGCLYGTAPDWMRLLRFVLNGGELDGRRLLSPATAQSMRDNQIGDLRAPRVEIPADWRWLSADIAFFPGVPQSHTFGFFRTEEDIPQRRSRGSLYWAGGANTHYWIDPSRGLAGMLMTQSFPFCDRRVMATLADFERAAYRAFAGAQR